jgi:hypothetical protein
VSDEKEKTLTHGEFHKTFRELAVWYMLPDGKHMEPDGICLVPPGGALTVPQDPLKGPYAPADTRLREWADAWCASRSWTREAAIQKFAHRIWRKHWVTPTQELIDDCIYPMKEDFFVSYDGTSSEDLGRTGVKYDKGKPMMSYIPASAMRGVAAVFQHGAAKYSDHNWRMGMDHTRLWNATQRHLWAWLDGENLDPDSDLPHLDHALCCLMMLQAHVAYGYGRDDRYFGGEDG